MLPERRARVVRVDGVFDELAALRLGEILEELAPGASLCVDLSHVRGCQGAALEVLARAVERRPAVRVDLLGPLERDETRNEVRPASRRGEPWEAGRAST